MRLYNGLYLFSEVKIFHSCCYVCYQSSVSLGVYIISAKADYQNHILITIYYNLYLDLCLWSVSPSPRTVRQEQPTITVSARTK